MRRFDLCGEAGFGGISQWAVIDLALREMLLNCPWDGLTELDEIVKNHSDEFV